MHELDRRTGDFYEHPEYYSQPHELGDRQALDAVRRVRGNPDAVVHIYRAVPPGVTHINTGDWVTPSLEGAKQLAWRPDGEHDHILHSQARAADVRWNGDAIQEFGYHGPPVAARIHKPPKRGW